MGKKGIWRFARRGRPARDTGYAGPPPGEAVLTRVFESKGRCLRQANRSGFAGGVSRYAFEADHSRRCLQFPNGHLVAPLPITSLASRSLGYTLHCRFPFQLTPNRQRSLTAAKGQSFRVGGACAQTRSYRRGRITVYPSTGYPSVTT
jgi:hypothetical protein